MATDDLILVSGLNQIKPRDSLQLRLWMDASKATDGAVKQRDFKSVLSNWGGSSPHTVLGMGEGLPTQEAIWPTRSVERTGPRCFPVTPQLLINSLEPIPGSAAQVTARKRQLVLVTKGKG